MATNVVFSRPVQSRDGREFVPLLGNVTNVRVEVDLVGQRIWVADLDVELAAQDIDHLGRFEINGRCYKADPIFFGTPHYPDSRLRYKELESALEAILEDRSRVAASRFTDPFIALWESIRPDDWMAAAHLLVDPQATDEQRGETAFLLSHYVMSPHAERRDPTSAFKNPAVKKVLRRWYPQFEGSVFGAVEQVIFPESFFLAAQETNQIGRFRLGHHEWKTNMQPADLSYSQFSRWLVQRARSIAEQIISEAAPEEPPRCVDESHENRAAHAGAEEVRELLLITEGTTIGTYIKEVLRVLQTSSVSSDEALKIAADNIGMTPAYRRKLKERLKDPTYRPNKFARFRKRI
jgi:hypothetical protein